jgi:hypothetical protein
MMPTTDTPPPAPPPPVARFGSDREWLAWKRLLFAKYLKMTGRLSEWPTTGKQDR